MAVWSDMNGFPEGGFPVLANVNDMITLGNLYLEPLKINNYIIDVLGNNRLAGALVIAGALTGVTSITANGAISGLTTIAANNTVTLSHATAPLTLSGSDANISMTGFNSSIGSMLSKIRNIFAKKITLEERPVVNDDLVALVSDITRHTVLHAPSDADNTLTYLTGVDPQSPVNDDQIIIISGGQVLRASIADFKSLLKDYFDTLYTPL